MRNEPVQLARFFRHLRLLERRLSNYPYCAKVEEGVKRGV